LPPPEAEKLASLAKAFQQRPQLSLEVRGQYHPEVDAPVLKALAVKRKLAVQMGFAVKPNQDPGPVSFTDSATQQALDSIAKQGLTAKTLRSLRKKFGIPLPKQKSITPPATKAATKKQSSLHQQSLLHHPIRKVSMQRYSNNWSIGNRLMKAFSKS